MPTEFEKYLAYLQKGGLPIPMNTLAPPMSPRPMRIRINVSVTSKGLPSPELTIDGQDSGVGAQDLLDVHRAIMQALITMYPAEVRLEPGTTIPPVEIETTEPFATTISPDGLPDQPELGVKFGARLEPAPDYPAQHTEQAHQRDMCLCAPIGSEPPTCDECGCCQCDEGDCDKSPSHSRGCSYYPHETGGSDE